MNLSDFGQTEETVVSLATVPNGLRRRQSPVRNRAASKHLVCTHAVHHDVRSVCVCALHTNPDPVVRSRTHGGF
jgi:hypothetical protein